MSFDDMKATLRAPYDRNVQAARFKALGEAGRALLGERPARRSIPSLSGPSGIGKTACVIEVAEEKGMELVQLDCSYMQSVHLAIAVREAANRIATGSSRGCVVLVDNLDQADDGWRELFLQYADGYLDTVVEAHDASAPDRLSHARVCVDEIPESLFIVGEQRPA